MTPSAAMARTASGWLACGGVSVLLIAMGLALSAPVEAQQAPPAVAPKATAKKGAPPPASPGGGADGQLRSKIEQIEEQLADMQVVVGTLESLGRGASGGPNASAAPAQRSGGGGVDQARLDSLETQIRALTQQVEQMAEQVRQLSGSRRGELAPPPPLAPPTPPRTERADVGRAPVPSFGETTVTPGSDRDPIGRLIEPSSSTGGPGPTPLPPAAAAAGSAKELYETAYGYLLQQDYGAAEVAFEEFTRRYPDDRLAPDAQYWLGEALYVQRRYKPAGQAFLRVIERHKSSAKVPNSILKLAQSLEQIGQKDCALFVELETRHPNAPIDVRTKARAMKQRIGC